MPELPPLSKSRQRDPVETASRLHDRAIALSGQGKHEQAKRSCLRSLEILQDSLGPVHPDLANVLNTLGKIIEDEGDYDQAERI